MWYLFGGWSNGANALDQGVYVGPGVAMPLTCSLHFGPRIEGQVHMAASIFKISSHSHNL